MAVYRAVDIVFRFLEEHPEVPGELAKKLYMIKEALVGGQLALTEAKPLLDSLQRSEVSLTDVSKITSKSLELITAKLGGMGPMAATLRRELQALGPTLGYFREELGTTTRAGDLLTGAEEELNEMTELMQRRYGALKPEIQRLWKPVWEQKNLWRELAQFFGESSKQALGAKGVFDAMYGRAARLTAIMYQVAGGAEDQTRTINSTYRALNRIIPYYDVWKKVMQPSTKELDRARDSMLAMGRAVPAAAVPSKILEPLIKKMTESLTPLDEGVEKSSETLSDYSDELKDTEDTLGKLGPPLDDTTKLVKESQKDWLAAQTQIGNVESAIQSITPPLHDLQRVAQPDFMQRLSAAAEELNKRLRVGGLETFRESMRRANPLLAEMESIILSAGNVFQRTRPRIKQWALELTEPDFAKVLGLVESGLGSVYIRSFNAAAGLTEVAQREILAAKRTRDHAKALGQTFKQLVMLSAKTPELQKGILNIAMATAIGRKALSPMSRQLRYAQMRWEELSPTSRMFHTELTKARKVMTGYTGAAYPLSAALALTQGGMEKVRDVSEEEGEGIDALMLKMKTLTAGSPRLQQAFLQMANAADTDEKTLRGLIETARETQVAWDRLTPSQRAYTEEAVRARVKHQELIRTLIPVMKAIYEGQKWMGAATGLSADDWGKWASAVARAIESGKDWDDKSKKSMKTFRKWERSIGRTGVRIGWLAYRLTIMGRIITRYINQVIRFSIKTMVDWEKSIETVVKAIALMSATNMLTAETGEYLRETLDLLISEGPRFQAAWTGIQAVLIGMVARIAPALIPALQQLVDTLVEMWPVIQAQITPAIEQLATETLPKLIAQLPALIPMIVQLVVGFVQAIPAILALLKAVTPIIPALARVFGWFAALSPLLIVVGTALYFLSPILIGISTLMAGLVKIVILSKGALFAYKYARDQATISDIAAHRATFNLITTLHYYRMAILKVSLAILAFIGFLIVLDKVFGRTAKAADVSFKDINKAAKKWMPKTSKIIDKEMGGTLLTTQKTLAELQKRFAEATEGMVWATESDITVTAQMLAASAILVKDEFGEVVYTIHTLSNTVEDAAGDMVGIWEPATGKIILKTGEVIDIFKDLGYTVTTTSGDVVEDLPSLQAAFGDLGTSLGDLESSIDNLADSWDEVDFSSIETGFEDVAGAMQESTRQMIEFGLVQMTIMAPIPWTAKALILLGIAAYEVGQRFKVLREAAQETMLEEYGAGIEETAEALQKLVEEEKLAVDETNELITWMYRYPKIFQEASADVMKFAEQMWLMGKMTYATYQYLLDNQEILQEMCFRHAAAAAEVFNNVLEDTNDWAAKTAEQTDDLRSTLSAPVIARIEQEGEILASLPDLTQRVSIEPVDLEPLVQTIQYSQEVIPALEVTTQQIQLIYGTLPSLTLPALIQTIVLTRELEEISLSALTQVVQLTYTGQMETLAPLMQQIQLAYAEVPTITLPMLPQSVMLIRETLEELSLPAVEQTIVMVRELTEIEMSDLTQTVSLVYEEIQPIALEGLIQAITFQYAGMITTLEPLIQQVTFIYVDVQPVLTELTQTVVLVRESLAELDLPPLEQTIVMVREFAQEAILPQLTQVIQLTYAEFEPVMLASLTQIIGLTYGELPEVTLPLLTQTIALIREDIGVILPALEQIVVMIRLPLESIELPELEQTIRLVYAGMPEIGELTQLEQAVGGAEAATREVTQYITIPLTIEIGTVSSEVDIDVLLDAINEGIAEKISEVLG